MGIPKSKERQVVRLDKQIKKHSSNPKIVQKLTNRIHGIDPTNERFKKPEPVAKIAEVKGV
jgi:hypothetical protein